MIIPKAAKYIRGYLTIRVKGLNLEKFLNASISHGVNFWDVKKVSMTEIQLKTSIKGYRLLKRTLKSTGCQLSIIDKNGFPFFMSKIKKRKMLGIGFIVFLFMIIILSSFIWSVRITGVKTINTKEIEQNLAELGVKPGALKIDLAVADIENNMLIKMGRLSWIKVRFVGTRAEVEIKERVAPPEMVADDKPCNIVAKRDGIITKIVSSSGDVVVSQGDPVKKGDILVTGIIERENMEKRYVHSSAEVIARTWYKNSVTVPLQQAKKFRTGNKIANISLLIGSKKIQIKNNTIPYKSYDKIEKSTKIIDTDFFQLPFEIVIDEYYETTGKYVKLTDEEAKALAAESAEKAIIDSILPDARVINKVVKTEIKDGLVTADVLIETIEDIGMSEELTVYDTPKQENIPTH